MAKIRTLCVIDDDLIYQFAVKLTIKNLDIAENVIAFSNGELAKDYIMSHLEEESNLPDLILLDINMPVMDGWDFLNWFSKNKKADQKKIPVFMVSSSIDWRDIEKAKSYSEVIDYVSKPLTDGSFVEIMEKMSSEKAF
jgi:response regulator RpfG family c-di-GMP phosphodiesterase